MVRNKTRRFVTCEVFPEYRERSSDFTKIHAVVGHRVKDSMHQFKGLNPLESEICPEGNPTEALVIRAGLAPGRFATYEFLMCGVWSRPKTTQNCILVVISAYVACCSLSMPYKVWLASVDAHLNYVDIFINLLTEHVSEAELRVST